VTSPALARELPDGSRRYTHPVTGAEVPSVTTVLSVIAKPALPGWAARTAAAYAVANWDTLGSLAISERLDLIRCAHEREAQAAASTGDTVHEMSERWATGTPFTAPAAIKGFTDQYIRFLIDVRPRFTENEVTLWSHRHRYAGTCDFIAEIDGQIILVDLKSGKKVHPEAALQVSALANADVIIREDGTEEPLPDITGLMILHVRPRSWKLIPVRHREQNTAAFLAARDLWGWRHEVAPAVYL
jgi:hypothetical protein